MTIRNLEKPLAVSAVALEGAAAIALLCGSGPAGVGRTFVAALAHALGAACATGFLFRRATRLQVGGRDRGVRLLFATASVVLPLVGPAALAALLAKMARRHHQPEPALARARLKELLGPLPPPTVVSAEIGLGSLEARLRFDPAPASRVAAVLATRRLRTPADAIRLLRLALRDRDEDVRLLAHALLEDRDREAFQRIEALERELAAGDTELAARVSCLLAEALYDLCASGLVGGELEAFTLRRARDLLEQARRVPAVRASAPPALLLGRVLLRQGEAQAACAAVEESGRLGAPAALLAPHLAEAAFQARQVAVPREAGA